MCPRQEGDIGDRERCNGGSEGLWRGPIPFDPDYLALFTGANAALVNVLNTWVVHKIPVFNRRQKATFNLLVARDDASPPVVTASCNHPGVRLEFLSVGPEVNGVPLNLAVRLGILVTAGVVLLLVRYQRFPHPYLTPLFAWFLGVYCAVVGAAAVKAWKAVGRILG